MLASFENWKQYAQGREVVTVRFTAEDIFNKAAWFKTHRDFLKAEFKKLNVEVLQYNHVYETSDPKNPRIHRWGLCFSAADSVVKDMYECHAIIGVNARYIVQLVP